MTAINDECQHAFSLSAGSDLSDIFNRNSYNSFAPRTRNAGPGGEVNSPVPGSTCSDDIVKVEITDFEGNASTNITIGALRRCKRHIVSPFYVCLKCVGWRQFGYGRVSYGNSKWWSVFNCSYVVVILCLLLFNYTFTVIACNSRLTTEIDDPNLLPKSTTAPTTPSLYNHTTPHSRRWITLHHGRIITTTTAPNTIPASNASTTCKHTFTSYIIPNMLHLLAYFLGFWHFRVRSNEDLDSLMEKVFLYCESTFIRHVSQKWLIRRLKSYVYFLVCWTLLAMVVHILCDICALRDHVPLIDDITNPSITVTLLIIDMIGIMIAVGVTMTVILNYVVNCELIIFYAKLVMNKLRERSVNLRVAIKDLYQINMATKRLNSTTALITSIMLLICLERIAIGSSILVKMRVNRPIVWAYRVLYILHQIPIVLIPLLQAARVNSFCSRILRTILEIRTFGYQNALQIELDSFVLFSKANKFRAKLFFVPIRGAYLIMITIAASFVFVLLVQNDYITDFSFV